MSQASANATLNSAKVDHKGNEPSQLKDYRPPTHNLAIEQAVLAALMTVAESFEQVGDVLNEKDF